MPQNITQVAPPKLFGRVVKMVNSNTEGGKAGKVLWRRPVKVGATHASLALTVTVFEFALSDRQRALTYTGEVEEIEFEAVKRVFCFRILFVCCLDLLIYVSPHRSQRNTHCAPD